jgi:PAS domain S-box-containing protein
MSTLPPSNPSVDRIVRLAATVLATPVALLTVVDGDTQRFASAYGLPDPVDRARTMPNVDSLCRSVVESGVPLVIGDTHADPRVSGRPAVTEHGVRAYLGVPVAASTDGVRATLCVVDRVSRVWSERDVAVMHDLAASVVTELALRDELASRSRSEEHFRAITEHSSDLVCVLDVDGAIRYVSPSIERALRFDAADMLGRDAFALVDHEDADRVRGIFAVLLAEPASSATFAFRCRHTTGAHRTVEGSARNLMDVPGVRGVVVNVADVTGRRLLEAQLRKAQKMEAIGLLAGGIAHEFNNLLTVIRGNLEFVRDAVPRNSQAFDDVAEAATATTRATALVRQLLAFGRRTVRQPAVIDLNAVITDASPMLRSALGEGTVLELELALDLWPVRVDRGQIEQVLMNLTLNGGDAMVGLPDGRSLGIETANVVVSPARAARLGVSAPGDYVRLTVRDFGVGMDEEIKARLFEPFFTTKPVGRGTGLGLAVVYGIVTQSDGAVQVDSEVGDGSRFHVFLPRIDAEVEGPIDDPRTFDTLSTDGRMPGMDGPSLVARLREARHDPPAPLISGFTSGALQGGPGATLPSDVRPLEKPFDAPELLDAVQVMLGAPPSSCTAA